MAFAAGAGMAIAGSRSGNRWPSDNPLQSIDFLAISGVAPGLAGRSIENPDRLIGYAGLRFCAQRRFVAADAKG
jgi:hypothetical protein